MQMGVAWVSIAAERKIHGSNGAGRKGGGGIVEGAVSRGAGDSDFLQRVAAGSGFANVDEQFGSGGGGEAGAEWGMLSRHRAVAAGAGRGRDAAGAIGQAGGNFSDA